MSPKILNQYVGQLIKLEAPEKERLATPRIEGQ